MQLTASAQTLAHRYSFYSEADGATNAVDLVGTNNGTFDGDAAVSGGQLVAHWPLQFDLPVASRSNV